MKKVLKTDWDKLSSMNDSDIDTSEIPELSDEFFKKSELRIPVKKTVTIRLDSDVLEWYKSQGKGYQTRINKLLRSYMEAQVNQG